jgi:hypothetical protein
MFTHCGIFIKFEKKEAMKYRDYHKKRCMHRTQLSKCQRLNALYHSDTMTAPTQNITSPQKRIADEETVAHWVVFLHMASV